MSGMEIRQVKTKDEADLTAALAREIWTEHYVPLIGAAQTAYMVDKFQSAEAIGAQIAGDGYEYYLAFAAPDGETPDGEASAGVPAGYFALKPEPEEGRVFLSKIYVKKEFRRRGIARGFLSLAFERARACGCTTLWLTVNRGNEGSIAAYRRLGFRVECTMVTDIGGGFVMDDYKMVCPVPEA